MRATLLTVGAGALVAASVTACSSSGTAGTGGTGQKTPAMALSAAVQKISDNNTATFEMTLKPDAALLAAVAKQGGHDNGMSDKVLSAGIDLKVVTTADKPLKDLKAGDPRNVELTLGSGGVTYIDIRMAGGALYAKVDVKDGAKLAGVPDSVITGELGSGKVPAPLAGAAQSLVNGDWVGISASDLKSVTQLLGSLGNNGDLSASPDGGASQAFAQIPATVITALSKDATITDKGDGKLEVSGKAKTIAQDLFQAVDPMLSGLPTGNGPTKNDVDKLKAGLNKIPDSQTLVFDVTLKDGTVQELSLDLAQFAPADQTGGGHLALDLKFGHDAPAIQAPSGATMIDLNKVISQLGPGL